MTVTVSFIKYYNYNVEVPDNTEDIMDYAVNIAEEDFENETRYPVADLTYDEVEVWNTETNEQY